LYIYLLFFTNKNLLNLQRNTSPLTSAHWNSNSMHLLSKLITRGVLSHLKARMISTVNQGKQAYFLSLNNVGVNEPTCEQQDSRTKTFCACLNLNDTRPLWYFSLILYFKKYIFNIFKLFWCADIKNNFLKITKLFWCIFE
jgi:hypothetical protein